MRETSTTAKLSIRIDAAIKKRLDALAVKTGRSQSALASEAIAAYVEYEEWKQAEIEAGKADADAAA